MKKQSCFRNFPIILLVLLLSNVACSSGNRTHTTTGNEVFSSEPFTSAPELERENTETVKINLTQRIEEIEILLLGYRAALDGTSTEVSRTIQQSIEDIEFEKLLIEALVTAFISLQHEDVLIDKTRADIMWIQLQLKAAYTQASFFEPNSDYVEPSFKRLIDPSQPSKPELIRDPEDPYDSDAWIIAALHVDPAELPDWFQRDVFKADTLTEYELTHQFIALLLQRYYWSGIQLGAEHETRIGEIATRIAQEQQAGVDFDNLDLYSERVAMLIAGGYGSLVEKEWVIRILNNRLPNGLWPHHVSDELADMHSTHVSLWAIAGYQVLMQRGEEGRQALFPFNP